MSDEDDSKYRSRVEKQATEIIDGDITAVELTSQLDFGYVKHNDQYAEWHNSTPLLPMVRALFLKELEGYSIRDLYRYLKIHPDDTATLGFDDVPARTMFGRAWRERFNAGLKHTIEFNAKRIREVAPERGNLMGLHAVEPEDKSGVSKRTADRFITEKSKEVVGEMQQLVFSAFDFDRADNTAYDTEAFCELQSHMGLSGSAAESGTGLFADDTTREGTPDGDTHLHNIKRLGPDTIQEMVDEGIGRMVHEAKHHLAFARPADVAIDMTYITYYGDRDASVATEGWSKTVAFVTNEDVNDEISFYQREMKG